MIEIAFDKHIDASFQGRKYPLLDVPDLCNMPFDSYIEYAKTVLNSFTTGQYLIVISDNKRFNTNKLALAFFICSCFNDKNSIECLVIKDLNYNEAFESYKPYVAISVGIKYALRLSQLPVDVVYKELKCLDYLGFSIKENFTENSIHYMPHNDIRSSVITNSVFDALLHASLCKILALAEIEIPFEVIVKITKDSEELDTEKLVFAILKKVSEYIDV